VSNNINRKTFDKEFKFEEGQWIKFENNNKNSNDINDIFLAHSDDSDLADSEE